MPNPVKIVKGVKKALQKEGIERANSQVVSAGDELARIAREQSKGQVFLNSDQVRMRLQQRKLERAIKEKEEAAKKAEEAASTQKKDADYEALKAALAEQKEEIATYQLTNSGAEVTVRKPAIHPSNAGASTLEAINRGAQEKAAGQVRVVLEPTGEVRPLIGVDAADARAYGGQIIVQKNVGAEEWTVLSRGPDVKDTHVKGSIARAKAELDKLK